MKRDLDLMRDIMRKLETTGCGESNFGMEGHDQDEVLYHVHLLGQQGLLMVQHMGAITAPHPAAYPLNITNDGHDFICASKEETLWRRAKKKVADTAGGIFLSVLIDYLKMEAQRRAGLPP